MDASHMHMGVLHGEPARDAITHVKRTGNGTCLRCITVRHVLTVVIISTDTLKDRVKMFVIKKS